MDLANQGLEYGKVITIAKTTPAESFAGALATRDNRVPIQAVTAI